MNQKLINLKGVERVRNIHDLSSKYNLLLGNPHSQRLLELMEEHINEIRDLIQNENPHGLVETGDLLILCLELLIEHSKDINDVFEFSCQRYEKKLSALINQGSI